MDDDPRKTLDLYASGLWMPTKVSWYTNPTDLSKWIDSSSSERIQSSGRLVEIARVVYSAAVKICPDLG